MEPWQIVFITLYGGLLAYLALSQVQQGKQLASIGTMVQELREDMKRQDSKLDLFLKTEVDTLKDLMRRFSRNSD